MNLRTCRFDLKSYLSVIARISIYRIVLVTIILHFTAANPAVGRWCNRH